MAHVQLIDPADLPRFAALGVIANLEPLWAQPDPLMTELTLPRVGAARGSRQYQIRSLLRSGARVSFGSDWPVTAYQPLPGIATAATRQTPAGHPDSGWLPTERVTAAAAVAAYSAGVAHQAFEEHHWGVLRPGMRADLVHPRRRPHRHPRPRAARPARAGHLARRNPHLLTTCPTPVTILIGAVPCPNPASAPERLEHGALGVSSIVFFVVVVVVAAAPLTVMAGIAPLAIMIGGIGGPAGYLIAGLILTSSRLP